MAYEMYVDESGIPYTDYGDQEGDPRGIQHSIVAVAERGLWYWNEFDLSGCGDRVLLSYDWTKWPINKDQNPTTAESAQTMLINCADWLMNKLTDRGSYLIWCYDYPSYYGVQGGWGSAHAQALGIQLLLRASEVIDVAYSVPVERLLMAFNVPIEDGGLLDNSDPQMPWFEKFASPESQRPKVLNGMLFALLGLHDTANRTGLEASRRQYESGLSSALRLMERYDLGNWSAYNIQGKRASVHYHRIHVQQLDMLFRIEGNGQLARWRDRFASYESPPRSRHDSIKSEVDKLQREQNKLKSELRAVRNSFSYRLGNMLVQAVASPGRNTILLPYRLIRLLVAGFRALRTMAAKGSAQPKTSTVTPSPPEGNLCPEANTASTVKQDMPARAGPEYETKAIGDKQFDVCDFSDPDRWGRILDRSARMRREGDLSCMQRLVEAVLAGKDSGLPPAYVRKFAAGLRAVAEDATRHREITSDLSCATKRLAPAEVGPDVLLSLCQLAICHGLFEVSGEVRRLSIEGALGIASSESAGTTQVLVGLLAALDSYDLTTAQVMRERLRAVTKKQPDLDLTDIDQYLGWLSGDRKAPTVTFEDTGSDPLWVELVKGRTVALVGPAPSDERSGQEIDSHQTIIRTNFRGTESLPPAVEAGRRTDISYYNGVDCRYIRRELDKHFFSELRMAVFRFSDDTDLAGTTPRRVASYPDRVFLAGKPLMGSTASFDLLSTGAAAVKLYNMNFFASPTPYSPMYRNQSVAEHGRPIERDHLGGTGVKLDRCRRIARHEPLSQLHFVQNLWRSGLVNADASCTRVLEMSDLDYLRALDNIYGREAR